MITNSYLQKKKYPSASDRPKSPSKYSSFSPSPSLHDSSSPKFNILKNSEPLNSISRDLSFKGSSVKAKDIEKEFPTVAKAIASFSQEFGVSATEHFTNVIERVSSRTSETGIKKVGDKLEFGSQTTWQKVKDIILYPFVKLPVDFAMGALELLKKIPGLKKSKTIDNMLSSQVFKKRKDASRLESEAAAVKNYFEQLKENKDFKAFKDVHSRLKPLVCNYSTTLERSVTRFVTGIIPAFFLANDAYNLSMYMKNNKDVAADEKKRRFNQEAARIAITTATTFGVLSFFAKKSNASETTTGLLMSGVVFVSEFLGRIAAGNPVLPIGKAAAQKYSEKRQKQYDDKKTDKKHPDSFRGNDGKDKTYAHPPEKGVLTFGNVMKVVGGLVAFGFAVDQVKGIDAVKKQLSKISKGYESHFKEDYKVERVVFDARMAELKANGFEHIAKKYTDMVKDQKGPVLAIGQKTKKVQNTVVNQILLFPVKFVWNNMVMLPFKITNTAVKAIGNAAKGKEAIELEKTAKEAAKTPEEKAKDAKAKIDKDLLMLQSSLGFLDKIKYKTSDEYKKQLNGNLLSGLDNVTKSNYSNAELGATVRTASSTVTSAFLVADSYNMVMIDSQGQNKDLASQKAKERTVQRGVRIAYGAFIQQLVNGLFKKTYDNSLIGAQVVNTANTFMTEVMERKSVGLPIGESTKEKIVKTERENLQADGIKGSYYRAMASLTGKKALSASAAKKEKDAKKA